MPPESGETRTLYVPRTGTKVSLLVGLAIILAAIYAAVMPLGVHSNTGPDLGCGSAISPVTDNFGKAYCQPTVKNGRYRAGGLLVGGLLLGGAGAALFGFDVSTRTRKPRPGFDDGYDDDDEQAVRPRDRRDRARGADAKYDDESDGQPRRRRHDAREADDVAPGEDAQDDVERVLGRARVRSAPARTGGASPAGRRTAPVADDRAKVDTTPADAAYDEPDAHESQSSLRRPFGDRFAHRDRRSVDVDEDDLHDEYDEQDGPRSRR